MRQFKIRASAASNLLTAGGKVSEGETAKTYLKEWLISEVTGKKKQVRSKYLSRGTESEAAGIERLSKLIGQKLTKNERFFNDEFFTGTPDLITDDTVIDVKCSWDAFTFPYFMDKPPFIYLVQLQVYMHLTGKRKAVLAYCLENGTMDQINSLAWQKAKEAGADEPSIEHWDEATEELNYDNLPDNLRIKTFDITYDEKLILNLTEAVKAGREYIKELLTQLNIQQ